MRVISQDRRYSFDFDRASFLRKENYISALIAGENRYILIGRYETEERAEEVFEDMHKAYNGYGYLFEKGIMKVQDNIVPVPIVERNIGEKVKRVPVYAGEHYVYYMPEE